MPVFCRSFPQSLPSIGTNVHVETPEKQDQLRLCCCSLISCNIVDHLQGSFGLFGPKSEKSLEKGSRGLSKKSKINCIFQGFLQVFHPVFDSLAPGTLSRIFSDFGPKSPNDPCKWSTILGKDLAPYRIGKHSNPEIAQKYRSKRLTKNMIFGIFGVFLPYFACGGVLLFCSRGPSFSQSDAATHLIQKGKKCCFSPKVLKESAKGVFRSAELQRASIGQGHPGECLTPPFANPGVAERAPWLSCEAWCGGGQLSIRNAYRLLSFSPHQTPSTHGG